MFLTLIFCAPLLDQTFAQGEQGQPEKHRAGEVSIEAAEAPVPGTNEKVPVDFGTLYVPENRNNPDSKLIGITFLRFKSTAQKPGPPIIYLEGGPGISGINSALGNLSPLFISLREVGDVVIPDQRGSGRSNRLTCPASTQELLGVSLKRTDFLEQVNQESRNCIQSLKEKGVDLSAYNTNENADDMDDLRKALGAPQADLLAYSYGTHLASALIKRHPDSFRRAVMVGTAGPDNLQKLPSGIQNQLIEINRQVQQDARLKEKVPDLLALMGTVLKQLEQQPVTIEVTNPKDKKSTRITVDKFAMQWLTASFISRRDFLAALPLLYYTMAKGNLSVLTAALSTVAQRTALPATQYTMRCASNVSRERFETIKREAPKYLLGDAVNFPFPEICGSWGVKDLGDSYRSPVKSKLPILFISGTLDANAPPANVEAMRKYLPNSLHLVVEGAEHEDFFMSSPLREEVRKVIVDYMKGVAPTSLRLKAQPISFIPIKE